MEKIDMEVDDFLSYYEFKESRRKEIMKKISEAELRKLLKEYREKELEIKL